MSSYTAHVFGKHGCKKCELLKGRLSKLLEKPEYQDVAMEYHDVLTLNGLVDFCKVGCLNPNRIPALVMADEKGYIRNPKRRADIPEAYAASNVVKYIGVQTDYDTGGGVISPAMIEGVLKSAMDVEE